MRISTLLPVLFSASVACQNVPSIADQAPPDLPGCVVYDMTPPPPKCAAAKGLPGDNLICVDFADIKIDQILVTPPPAELPGWDFEIAKNGCWQIVKGVLQIQQFGMLKMKCTLSMPAIDLSEVTKQNYQTIILSIKQKLDLDPGTTSNQFEYIYNGSNSPGYLLNQITGTYPEQQFIVIVDKQNLPMQTKNIVNFILEINSITANSMRSGPQITSIAVNASP